MSRATTIVEKLMWLWVLILLVSGAQLAVWWLDRRIPFELLTVTAQPVQRGGILRVDGTVRRDLERDCSIVASRYLVDSRGTRYEVIGMTTMTPTALRKLDAAAPGEVHLAIQIPPHIEPGPAMLVTALAYACNPLQDVIRPLNTEMIVPFEVLP